MFSPWRHLVYLFIYNSCPPNGCFWGLQSSPPALSQSSFLCFFRGLTGSFRRHASCNSHRCSLSTTRMHTNTWWVIHLKQHKACMATALQCRLTFGTLGSKHSQLLSLQAAATWSIYELRWMTSTRSLLVVQCPGRWLYVFNMFRANRFTTVLCVAFSLFQAGRSCSRKNWVGKWSLETFEKQIMGFLSVFLSLELFPSRYVEL